MTRTCIHPSRRPDDLRASRGVAEPIEEGPGVAFGGQGGSHFRLCLDRLRPSLEGARLAIHRIVLSTLPLFHLV